MNGIYWLTEIFMRIELVLEWNLLLNFGSESLKGSPDDGELPVIEKFLNKIHVFWQKL